MTNLEERLNLLGDVLDDRYGPIALHELAERAGAHGTIIEEFTGQDSLVSSVGSPHGSAASEVCDASRVDLTVFDLRQPAESAGPPRRKRRAALAVAVAAALVLAVGLVVTDQDNGNVITETGSSADVVEDAPPLAVADLGLSLWSLVSYENGTGLRGVVAAGPGFVAVGERDGNAAVWTSVDGLAWSRVPHDEAVFGGDGGSEMAAVAVGGPGLVAVGSQSVCTEEEVLDEGGSPRVDEVGNPEANTVCVDGNAAVWTSVDGLTWSRVPHDEAVFGGQRRVYEMNSVTAGGPGLVAVGQSDAFGEGDPLNEGDVNDRDAVVWISVDGLTWSRVPHDETVFGGVNFQNMIDVTVGGPGLVAVGQDGGLHFWGNSRVERPGVWTSADGLSWTRVPQAEEEAFASNSAMLSVTAGGPGLVAVGHGEDWVSRVWTSVDGVTWSRVTHANEAELGEYMTDLAAGGPGLIAVGSRDDEDAVWTSPDGLTWSLAPNILIREPRP